MDYGKLVYDNLSIGASRRSDVYGEGAMSVTVKGFLKWSMGLDIGKPCVCFIWLYPAPLYRARFIKDPRYTKIKARRPAEE